MCQPDPLLATHGLGERISVRDDYSACQAWARAFLQRLPTIAGIRYRAQAGAATANVVLFAERCAGTAGRSTW